MNCIATKYCRNPNTQTSVRADLWQSSDQKFFIDFEFSNATWDTGEGFTPVRHSRKAIDASSPGEAVEALERVISLIK